MFRRVATCLAVASLVACGSRTALEIDAAEPPRDAGPVAAPADASLPPEVPDAEPDPGPPVEIDADAPPDAGSLLDAALPDAAIDECPNARSTPIYLLTDQVPLNIVRFDPATQNITTLGTVGCRFVGSAASLTVDRAGRLYIQAGGFIYRSDPTTNDCVDTGRVPGQGGFDDFGMAFVADIKGNETLYIASYTAPRQLGTLDPVTLLASSLGPLPVSASAELTGNHTGRLFGRTTNAAASSSNFIFELDPGGPSIIAQDPLPVFGFGIAFWGGSFWLFDNDTDRGTTVRRYDFGARKLQDLGVIHVGLVISAGVSTCAPLF